MIEKIYRLFVQHPKVSTDTRRIEPGSLFFALKGANFDGNTFALKALEAGAAYAIVDDKSLKGVDPRVVCVDNVLRTLQLLAAHHRQELAIPIIAITGSNGKTTTKELLCAVLSQRYRVTATVGNLNNHIGVPLTLLSMNSSTEIGVVEMGANAQGEIAALCEIAAPDYGIINNIGRAHLEGFGGEEGIKRGKGELYRYLQAHGGVAFVAANDSVLMGMSQDVERVEYPYAFAEGLMHQLEGDYNLKNIAAAVAIGMFFRVESEDIHLAIASYTPQNNRSQRCETEQNTLIVDCYNANPSSMEVSIMNFAKEDFGRAKAMILGDMFELGAWSAQEHLAVVALAQRSGCEKIILVGNNFGGAYLQVSNNKIIHFPCREDLEAYLTQNPMRNYAILIKGSRAIGLEKIIKML
ncbi:MAG: UDP-N-acetylmuramoyl-tripeptide--D-alanyl-D-alanine ligase [Rikenellaceae bacterium]